MQSIQLTNGSIPQVGLGLWKVNSKKEAIHAIRHALDVGYRHFDSAQIYGNEAYLGQALKESGVDRSELFITTKIWNGNQKPDKLEKSLHKSLEKLQTDYVDLILLHFPVSGKRQAAWAKLESMADSGMFVDAGVSNYTVRHLEELLSQSSMKPAVNQVELHVYLQQPELVKYCADNGIPIEAYSPLAHGHGLDNAGLIAIAGKHGKSAAQVMIRWCIEKNHIVLPKSVTPARIEQNIDVFDFSLDADDMKKIEALEENMRTCWDPTDVK